MIHQSSPSPLCTSIFYDGLPISSPSSCPSFPASLVFPRFFCFSSSSSFPLLFSCCFSWFFSSFLFSASLLSPASAFASSSPPSPSSVFFFFLLLLLLLCLLCLSRSAFFFFSFFPSSLLIDAEVVLFFDAYISISMIPIVYLFMVNVYILLFTLQLFILIDRPLRQSSSLQLSHLICRADLASRVTDSSPPEAARLPAATLPFPPSLTLAPSAAAPIMLPHSGAFSHLSLSVHPAAPQRSRFHRQLLRMPPLR